MSVVWPESITAAIHERLGDDLDVSPAGGMSGSSVFRLSGNGRTAILKCSSNHREWHVYTRLAGALQSVAVEIPHLYAEHAGDDAWWLLLEDVPGQIRPERWLARPDVVGMLRALHSVPLSTLDLEFDRYIPSWTESLTLRALEVFPQPIATDLWTRLEAIQHAAQSLFEPCCLVSADPNPANWGLRDDGAPVLFDWERCTIAHPAIDLGITVPGLGSARDFVAVARAYAGDDRLAPDIAHAKLWSVVEFLAGYASGEIAPSFDITALIDRVPGWLRDEVPGARA